MDDIDKMEAMRDMVDTDGWKMVEKFILDRVSENKNRLLTCPIDEVIKHRAKIEAFNSVFCFIDHTIETGRSVRTYLQDAKTRD